MEMILLRLSLKEYPLDITLEMGNHYGRLHTKCVLRLFNK